MFQLAVSQDMCEYINILNATVHKLILCAYCILNRTTYIYIVIFSDNIHIGASDPGGNGVFVWSDGSLLTNGFIYWASGQPDKLGENCGHMWPFAAFQWNDIICSTEFWSICQYDWCMIVNTFGNSWLVEYNWTRMQIWPLFRTIIQLYNTEMYLCPIIWQPKWSGHESRYSSVL